jgi:hypothetical protein
MQLWNDWNTQVHEWASRHSIDARADSYIGNSDGTVDYLWIRSEDLLPGSPQRLECLHALAKFVGSTLTQEQICALSHQNVHDYGKSIEYKVLVSPEPHMDIGERWKQLERNKENERRHNGRGRQSPRRRLTPISVAKIVPSRFLRDFETWRDLVQSIAGKNVQPSTEGVLDGLIRRGIDLRKQWDLNDNGANMEETGVRREDILVLIQQLRVTMQETRLYKHNQRQKERPGDPNVKRRYGKWQAELANNTKLAKYFYQEGAKGLELFGYHPARVIHYQSADQEMIDDCPNAAVLQS